MKTKENEGKQMEKKGNKGGTQEIKLNKIKVKEKQNGNKGKQKKIKGKTKEKRPLTNMGLSDMEQCCICQYKRGTPAQYKHSTLFDSYTNIVLQK